jgi:hypothetical protein
MIWDSNTFLYWLCALLFFLNVKSRMNDRSVIQITILNMIAIDMIRIDIRYNVMFIF